MGNRLRVYKGDSELLSEEYPLGDGVGETLDDTDAELDGDTLEDTVSEENSVGVRLP